MSETRTLNFHNHRGVILEGGDGGDSTNGVVGGEGSPYRGGISGVRGFFVPWSYSEKKDHECFSRRKKRNSAIPGNPWYGSKRLAKNSGNLTKKGGGGQGYLLIEISSEGDGRVQKESTTECRSKTKAEPEENFALATYSAGPEDSKLSGTGLEGRGERDSSL